MSETPLPLSVLELSTVGTGQSTADALAATVRVAQTADRLGYRRIWVAEHHNMPAVASTNPPVLIAHLAAVTERIAVGSGGVMLPNHAPLVVAEQFALLEALHPGRIDLGIGRAPGTDQHTALALRRDPKALSAEDFPQNVVDLLGLFGDDQRRVVGQHDAARADPDPPRDRGQVRDEHRRAGARHRRHVVVLGHPDPAVAQPVGGLRDGHGGRQGLGGGLPGADRGQLEDGQGQRGLGHHRRQRRPGRRPSRPVSRPRAPAASRRGPAARGRRRARPPAPRSAPG